MSSFNWGCGWLYCKGKEILFDDRFLDVAVKLQTMFGGNLKKEGSCFAYSVSSLPDFQFVDLEFIKGVFEAGGVWGNRTVFVPSVSGFDKEMNEVLELFSPLKTDEGYFLSGDGAVLFLHAIYDESEGEYSEFHMERFLSFLYGKSWSREFVEVFVEEGGKLPFKKRVSDSGWDLELVELIKKDGSVYFFDTKVKIKPPPGFYLDLVPRSSIYKSGFVLANSVGIIDMTYRGTIKVPLVKVDLSKDDPQLPWRAVQLIPRKYYPLEFKKVESLDKTIRGEGGFGSTGK